MSHKTGSPCASPAEANPNPLRSSTPRVWFRAITAAVVVIPASLLIAYSFLYFTNLALNHDLPPDLVLNLEADGVSYPGMSSETDISYGTGDLPAFLFWTLGLSLMLFFLTALLTQTTHGRSTLIKSVTWLLLGPLVGFAWTLFVAFALGPWMGAFSFPVLYCWVGGATFAALAVLCIRPAIRDA